MFFPTVVPAVPDQDSEHRPVEALHRLHQGYEGQAAIVQVCGRGTPPPSCHHSNG